MHSPLEQFTAKSLVTLQLFGYDVSIYNTIVPLLVIVPLVLGLFSLGMFAKTDEVPGKFTAFFEGIWAYFSREMHVESRYLGIIVGLFLTVFLGFLFGMVPTVATFSSSLINVLTMSLVVYVFFIFLGLSRRKTEFFTTFMPSSVPKALAPLIVPLELIGFIVKPLSLTVRLVINSSIGHVVLKVFAGLILKFGVVAFPAFLIMIGVSAMEFLVAGIQAFVFSKLAANYLHDMTHSH